MTALMELLIFCLVYIVFELTKYFCLFDSLINLSDEREYIGRYASHLEKGSTKPD